MAKNYNKSNFAINKYSENIVYKSVDGNYEITIEQFLFENPNLTEADFEYWKSISDDLYNIEANKTTNRTRLDVSIEEIEETQLVATDSAEKLFIAAKTSKKITLSDLRRVDYILYIENLVLTDIQKRRFIAFYIDEKKEQQIADEEGTNQSSISRSISASEKKIKEFLKNICIKHGISDIK